MALNKRDRRKLDEDDPSIPSKMTENQKLTFTAAQRLYEKGLHASSVVGSLKRGGHALHDVAYAVKHFPEMDAMLFGDAWGGNEIEQHDARGAFLDARP